MARPQETSSREDEKIPSLWLWGLVFFLVTILYALFASIQMPTGVALCAWIGAFITIPVWFGFRFAIRSFVPFVFMALVIPLPYTVSATANAHLRHWVATQAARWADVIGLDVAGGVDGLIVGQYHIAVENACAGISTTLSLIALSILFAYWIGRGHWAKGVVFVVLSIPIAMIVNVARVVALIGLVANIGPNVLDTIVHPLVGVFSFVVAGGLLVGVKLLLGPSVSSKPLKGCMG